MDGIHTLHEVAQAVKKAEKGLDTMALHWLLWAFMIGGQLPLRTDLDARTNAKACRSDSNHEDR